MTGPDRGAGPADPPCSLLRHKGMYVTSAPDAGGPGEAFDATAHWCLATMRAIGPDGRPAGRAACGPRRRCCPESPVA